MSHELKRSSLFLLIRDEDGRIEERDEMKECK